MLKPDRIEDIDIREYVGLPPLDHGIDKLVRVFIGMGYHTIGSCEGHLDNQRWPYPWVTVSGLVTPTNKVYQEIKKMIDQYNPERETEWEIGRGGVRPSREASNLDELRRLQESGEELARFLFDNFLKH